MKFIKFVSLALFIVIVVVALSYEKIIARVLLPQYIEWAHETDMKGLKIGQPLNEQELVLAAEIGIKQPKKVRIVYVDEVPYPYENFALNRPKLAHELVHVLQIERASLDEVVTQHFFDMAEYGYDKAPLEVEASAANIVYSADW